MSLINDALKKAQRQRGDDSPGEMTPAGPGRVARRDKPTSFSTLLLRAGIGIIAICAIVVTTVLLMRQPEAPPVTTVPPPVAPKDNPTTAANQAPSTSEPVIATPVAPKTDTPVTATTTTVAANPPATTTANSSPATSPETTPANNTSSGPIQVPNLTLPPVADTPAIPAPTSAAEQDKRILAYLANLRITGIRPSGADSKVLMNDRVYKLNDVVDYTLGLKLTGVAVQRLDFVDERGVKYVKQF